MPIVVPGRRVGTAYNSSTQMKKRHHKGKRSVYAPLMLTSMIDMFTILVLYLIQLFGSTGQILFLDEQMKLPEAVRAKDIMSNPPVITIGRETIAFNGEPVEQTVTLLKNGGFEDGRWPIPMLEEKLEAEYKRGQEIKEKTQGKYLSESARGMILVQAHQGVPYQAVKKVLLAAAKHGFTQANFAVVKAGTEPPPG